VKVRNAPIANSGIRPIGYAAEGEQQQPGRDSEINDADREHQAPPGDRERPRQKFVLGDHPA
jgi:hypothetical protein